MAKKKGNNNNNKSNANSVDAAAAKPPAQADEPAETQQQQQTAGTGKSVADMTVEELRAELLAARAELAGLKSNADSAAAPKVSKPQEVQELHTKLQQLRKEQQEADAARDKAWKQLKVAKTDKHEHGSPTAGMNLPGVVVSACWLCRAVALDSSRHMC